MSHHPYCDCGGCLQSANLWAAVRAHAPKAKVRSRFWGLFVMAAGLSIFVAGFLLVSRLTVGEVATAAFTSVLGGVCFETGLKLFRGQA